MKRSAQDGPQDDPDNALRFLVNGELHVVPGYQPDLMLLGYLREQLRLTGTKEGCGIGDCGACTVVVAELDAGDRLRLRPLNACLQLLAGVDGKAVFTVEGLGSPGALHPVQEAMFRCHGSQCGFCTPGFVMALFALFKNATSPDRAAVLDALSGNLCRCTGYRPIIAAAQSMYTSAGARGDDWLVTPGDDAASSQLIAQLRGLRRRRGLMARGAGCIYLAPRSLVELTEACAQHPRATLLAGGTDLALGITRDFGQLPAVISVAAVPELGAMREEPEAIVIGAAAPVASALDALAAHYPDLAGLKRRFGGPGIRMAATLGGNIAHGSPVGDAIPVLMALGATLHITARDRSRQVQLDDYCAAPRPARLQPGEFIEAIRVPRPAGHSRFATYKVAKRFDQDIASVSAAFCLEFSGALITGARIAYGGLDSIPRRARACEQALLRRRWDAVTLGRALAALDADFEPLSDLRGSREYRRTVAGNLLRRFFLETTTTTALRLEAVAMEAP